MTKEKAAPKLAQKRPNKKKGQRKAGMEPLIELDNYIPAYLTFLANKWGRSASHLYLTRFGIGIEAWRILVLLAIEGAITANRICQVIGMDKASVSRNVKRMQEMDLLSVEDNPDDGRQYFIELTQKGFELHDSMIPLVQAREERLLSCLTKKEQKQLCELLRRVHANLPALDDPKDYEF